MLGLLLTGAAVADVAWDSVFRLTTNPAGQVTGFEGQCSIGADPAGNVWVVWLDQRTVPSQLWYRRRDPSGTWLPEQQLTSRAYNCYQPALACDAGGNIHVAWHIQSSLEMGIWYKRYESARQRWTPDTLLVPVVEPSTACYPALAATPGRAGVHLAWYGLVVPDTGQQVSHREYRPDSGWGALTRVSVDTGDPQQVAVGADGLDGVAIVWQGIRQTVAHVLCRRRVAGQWQPVELVSDLPNTAIASSPAVALSPDGTRLHVVWHGRRFGEPVHRVRYRCRTAGGWLAIEDAHPPVSYNQEQPSVCDFGGGRCGVAWRAADASSPGDYQLWWAERDSSGRWTDREQLTAISGGDVMHPSAISAPGRTIQLVWYDNHSGNQDVYYLRGTIPSGVAERSRRPAAPSAPARLLDACGRVVSGVRRPGVYFIQPVSGGPARRKVVVFRWQE